MNLNSVKRPWGTFQVIDKGPGFIVKRIEVQLGNCKESDITRFSDQYGRC